MPGARNIVKIMILIAVILLLGMNRYAHAQINTGAAPYLNSWHTYRVVVGNVLDPREWEIINHDTTIVRPLDDAMAWCDIPALSVSNADISICFTDSVFNLSETWYLRYRERSIITGTCTAARRFTINLTENDFYLTMDANDTICKVESGQVNDWTNVDNETFNTVFTYRVTLHKLAGLTLTGWSFDAVIDLLPVNHAYVSYTVAVVPVSEGAATLTDLPVNLDGQFNVSMSPLSTPDLTEVSVDVVVTLNGLLHNGIRATLRLLNGQAISGVTGTIITFDNTDRPIAGPPDNVTDAALRDRLQVIVIDPLPATQNILAGAGETATSAQNPLQNSTHNYTVVMGNLLNNYANAGTVWHIETSLGLSVPELPANYELTRISSATNDMATIIFHMSPGSYVLYYTEESDNGCSAVRSFPFTIQEPFDVDVAEIVDDCPSASDIIFPNLAETTTTVNYVVTLNTSSYGSNWSFDITLSDPGFGADLDVTNVSDIVVTGGSYSGGIHSGTISVLDPVTVVTISVTYTGLYANEHTITATLSNITGSFNEVDADFLTGTGNSTEHIIYSMPQVTVLAGVD
jgi:hypothetical protein